MRALLERRIIHIPDRSDPDVLAEFPDHDYFEPVAIVLAVSAGALATLAATLGILVLNVVVAAGLQRGFDRFEAAYDAYRRANAIPDIFYEEADLAEAAERDGA